MTGRNIRIGIVLLCLVWAPLAVPAYAAEAPRALAPMEVKDAAGKAVGLYKESHALIIGVSNYEFWPKLPGVLADVAAVKSALEKVGFQVEVVMDVDQDGMRKAFENFIDRYGHGADNRLLFYYAGHGHTLKLAYGGEMGYIVPKDAPSPERDREGFLKKALDMQRVEVFAKQIESKHALFLFDSCFSGSLFALSRAVPQDINYKTSKPVRQFITAGAADETVPDRSIFREQFVSVLLGEEELGKDGYVTGSELGQFLEKTVTNYSNGSQHPQYGKIRDKNLDRGDFVFPLRSASLGSVAKAAPAPAPTGERLQGERKKLEVERRWLEEEKHLVDERRKLEEEKQKLVVEREKIQVAKLEPQAEVEIPRQQPRGNCPERMGFIPAGRLASVKVTKGTEGGSICMDQHEVTQAEFERVMENNPSRFKGPNLPVDKATWYEASEYCGRVGKRLPTEWEWEFAARGGTWTAYYWGDDPSRSENYAWTQINSDRSTHPVGQKKANAYGLYDMSGNVWEWTGDYVNSPKGGRVVRGGSWLSGSGVNLGRRLTDDPNRRSSQYGFRCAQ
jgi:hypothetical protein